MCIFDRLSPPRRLGTCFTWALVTGQMFCNTFRFFACSFVFLRFLMITPRFYFLVQSIFIFLYNCVILGIPQTVWGSKKRVYGGFWRLKMVFLHKFRDESICDIFRTHWKSHWCHKNASFFFVSFFLYR